MATKIFKMDCVLVDNSLLQLGFDIGNNTAENYVPHFDKAAAVAYLRAHPDMAARFLSLTAGNGTVYWAGAASSNEIDGKSAGVNVVHRRDGDEAVGDNAFGRFLEGVRDQLRLELYDILVEEEPVREGQVIADFTRKGALASDIEERERAGEQFIHVDVYRPAKFRFDAGMDGTTGHASRKSDDEVPFHKFVCPFGTSYPSPVVVGSAAEASILYEQALRGEIDWKALFASLRERNLLDSKLTGKQLDNLISDLSNQFDWMREEIVNNPALKERSIVCSSFMVDDASMGRSIYDAQCAPSPAHVLARYINNPLLLFVGGENGVMRSLGLMDKGESERFVAVAGKEGISILVAGSDTIGGREPGRKATTKVVRSETVVDGMSVINAKKVSEIPQKTKEARERDYAAFSSRLDSVLSGLDKDVKVQFITGNSSSFGNAVGIGTPRMLERYVKEHGGAVLQYDFSRGKAVARANDEVANANLSVVLMEHFGDCLPALTGKDRSVEFRLDPAVKDSEVVFNNDSLKGDVLICFSDSKDLNVRNVLSAGTLACDSGLPVVHVMDNQSEEAQRENLMRGALASRSGYHGDTPVVEHIFHGEVGLREDWNFDEANHLSMVDSASGIHFPLVAQVYPSPVIVDGVSFKSPLGVYMALAVTEMAGVYPSPDIVDGNSGNAQVKQLLKDISLAEGSSSKLLEVYDRFLGGHHTVDILGDFLEEELLRKSIRMMAEKNSSFADALLDLDSRSVVMSSTSVSLHCAYDLFVGPDGKGMNRFGIALSAESGVMKQMREALRIEEENERARLVDEAAKRQKIATGSRAEGQKVVGGLPRSIEESKGAVWFIGTHNPIDLALKDGDTSFVMWNDMGGEDPLVREKAARPFVDDGEGGKVTNNFVFLFPTDLESFTGRRAVRNLPESKNLTGVTRVDPKTGVSFPAAVGIPVRYNNRGYEKNNAEGFPCSYRLDNEVSKFSASVVLSDSKARSVAILHDQALCLPGRERTNGTSYYTLGQVFMDKYWGVKEDAKDEGEKAHAGEARKKEFGMVDNPHRAPLHLAIVDSYISLLESGSKYPLNCIPMPRGQYVTQDDAVVRQRINDGERFVSAEGRFISDLMFSLQIANATAIALGVPLRFPLDEKGRIDLGPGVPEEYRLLAEKRIDSFIGVKKEEELVSGKLPKIERIPLYEAGAFRDLLVKDGTYPEFRPNDLAVAFGAFDFSDIAAGKTVPLHEMSFRMEDGTVFTLKDAKTTSGLSTDEINKYLNYSRNDLRRFVIRTTDPEKTPLFISSLKAYAERAKAVNVEVRLVRESERPDMGMEGYVNLLSSNSSEFAVSEHDIGREMTFFNGTGTVAQTKVKDVSGKVVRIDEHVTERDVDGNKVEEGYWGKVDAGDAFRGYAQIRYSLPGKDDAMSSWRTITDLELAKDTVMSLVHRTYRSDSRVVPSDSVLEMLHKAAAVQMAGSEFRDYIWKSTRKEEVADDKVVNLERQSDVHPAVEPEPVPVEEAVAPVDFVPEDHDIVFTESSGGYQQRTRENALSDDVDFTIAVAVDFNTYGERATAKAAGDSYISVQVEDFSDKSVRKAVKEVYDQLPKEFQKGEPMGINFAGNGVYTLLLHSLGQDQADEFMVKLISGLQAKGVVFSNGRSGGQSGIDEAALVAGKACGIPMVCHAPKGWLMRGELGKDVSDESAFKSRFENKDYKKLASLAVKPRSSRKVKGQNIN